MNKIYTIVMHGMLIILGLTLFLNLTACGNTEEYTVKSDQTKALMDAHDESYTAGYRGL